MLKLLLNYLLITSLFIFHSFLFSGNLKTVTLSDFYKPLRIAADDENLYVAEMTSIYIYSLKNLKLKRKFGSKGIGPGEFRYISGIIPQKNRLVINSIDIIYFFKKTGEFITQKKTAAIFCERLIPFEEKFVGSTWMDENKSSFFTLNFFDANLLKGQELFRLKRKFQSKGPVNLVARQFQFFVSNNKVFVDDGDKTIFVFNKKGEIIQKIELPIERVKITSEFKKSYINYWKKSRRKRPIFEMFKSRIFFPNYFPGIFFYHVDDAHIYVVSRYKNENTFMCFIMNHNGKLLKKKIIPVAFRKIIDPLPYTFMNETFYQLVDNVDKEQWELIIIPLG